MSFPTFLFKKALFQGRARQAPEGSESEAPADPGKGMERA